MIDKQGDKLVVAEIGPPHGVRGLVKIRAHTEDPKTIFTFGALEDEDGRAYRLTFKGHAKGGLIAAIDGIDDRDAAERLRGRRLLAARAALPPTDESAGEYYHADLIGLAVHLPDGARFGTVRAVHDYGGGDLLEVDPDEGRRTSLIPFTKEIVPEIDLAAGRLVIAPIDGLLEPAEAEKKPKKKGGKR